jgi:hypothetical protein
VRARRYLNNVVEQDHRAIKQRCASMLGLKSFRSAAVTLAGIELAQRIRKGQHLLPIKLEGRRPSLKEMWECALNPASKSVLPEGSCFPPMHQISRRTKRDSSEEFLKSEFPPVRYLRKFSFGGSLCFGDLPRCWTFEARVSSNRKTQVRRSGWESLGTIRASFLGSRPLAEGCLHQRPAT